MAYWLMKQEPDSYSYDDLARDEQTLWDGITNALALKHLRSCQAGDLAFYYHTGKEKAIVGVMEILGPAVPDPKLDDLKLVVVPVRAVRKFSKPVPLSAIKAEPLFADWELIRISRLSVMPCSEERWKAIEAMAGEQSEALHTKPKRPPRKKS